MIIDDDEDTEGCNAEYEENPNDEIQLQELALSKISAYGFDGLRTMKLMGVINERPIVVMIDSDATHCFVAKEMVTKLGLSIDDTTILPVRLGDGNDT